MSVLEKFIRVMVHSDRFWFFLYGYVWCMVVYKMQEVGFKRTVKFCWRVLRVILILACLLAVVAAGVYGFIWLAEHDWMYPFMTFGFASVSLILGVIVSFYVIESADK